MLLVPLKWPFLLDYCSFYVAAFAAALIGQADFLSLKGGESLEKNKLVFLAILIVNEKYKRFLMQILFILLAFSHFVIKNYENNLYFYLSITSIIAVIFIYFYQYRMRERILVNEKKLSEENNQFIMLYNSILKHYPSALICFQKAGDPIDTLEWRFSNDIARDTLGVHNTDTMSKLFEDIHLNTSNLFDPELTQEYSPKIKHLKKHLLESMTFADSCDERTLKKPKKTEKNHDFTPQIKKFLTTYTKSTENSETTGIEARKYRICIIKFYHHEKTSYLLNMEDAQIEEEVVHLREMDKTKDEMLASITHDLRSPLASMLKCIEFAIESKDLRENHQNLELATNSGMMLMHLINDILDYSLMKKGKFKMNCSFFPLEKLIKETIDMMKIQGDLKNISIISDNKCRKALTLYSDSIRIKQILVNLISNSLKFTKSTGQIVLEISQNDPKLILFTVSDNGIGIKPELIPKLCNPFHSYDYDGRYNKQGIGLGLHICKNIISELGPEKQLKIESVYEKGSKFSFILFANNSFHSEICIPQIKLEKMSSFESFPFLKDVIENSSIRNIPYFCKEVQFPNKKKIPETMQNMEIFYDGINEKTDKKTLSHRPNMIKRACSSMNNTVILSLNDSILTEPCILHILLADDDVFTMMLMKKMMNKYTQDHTQITINVDTAYDGLEALLLYEKNKPEMTDPYDLILLDCIMPIKDGFATAFELKKLINDRNYQKCPIIGCTAFNDTPRCLASGMDGILIKPIEFSKLYDILSKIYMNKVTPLP